MDAEKKAHVVFMKRRRIALSVCAFALLLGLFRYPTIAVNWPMVSDVAFALYMIFTFIGGGLLIWAWRCTVCKGGIKLDGTCSKCGRIY